MQERKDLDLNYFKQRLLKEKTRLEEEIAALSHELNIIASEGDIDDQVDMADLEATNERDITVARALKKQLADVEDALKKIAQGSYGYDEVTKKPIPKERLEAYPAVKTA